MLSLGSLPAWAQVEENAVLDINVGDLGYTVKQEPIRSTAGEVVEAVLDVLADKVTKEEPGYADAVRASIITALGEVRRFRVSDGTQADPTERTAFLADGVINYISVTAEQRSQGEKGRRIPEYFAQVGVTLNLKDPDTGTLLNSQVFEVNRNSWTWWRSPDSAIRKALEILRTKITKYFNSAYPYTARVLERGPERNGRLQQLYIDLGASHGLQRGAQFAVYAFGDIAGKETRREIGRLKVTRVEGDEVSLCKVISGGQEIKAALDGEAELQIVSLN